MKNFSEKAYTLTITNTGNKTFKNLPKRIRKTLLNQIQILKINPLKGQSLKGKFKQYRSFHSNVSGVAYRTVYKIRSDRTEVEIQLIGTRENFYRKLEEMRA